MDDALYLEPIHQAEEQIGWRLVVAVADPTAYIPLDSQIEQEARQRCFTNYLPGFNIPMLPPELSDERCSLMQDEIRPALVCYIETDLTGNITEKPRFVSAYVQSKAKLAYDHVSDYLENCLDAWQPENPQIAQQIQWLHQFTQARIEWRKQHALLFKEKPRLFVYLSGEWQRTSHSSTISSHCESNGRGMYDPRQHLCCTLSR